MTNKNWEEKGKFYTNTFIYSLRYICKQYMHSLIYLVMLETLKQIKVLNHRRMGLEIG